MSKAINPGMIVLPAKPTKTPMVGVVLGYFAGGGDFMGYLNARAETHDRTSQDGVPDMFIEYAHEPADIRADKDIEYLTAEKPYIVRWSDGTVMAEALDAIVLRDVRFWLDYDLTLLLKKLWKDGQIEFLLPKVEHAAH